MTRSIVPRTAQNLFRDQNEIDTIAGAKRLIDVPDVTLYTIVTK